MEPLTARLTARGAVGRDPPGAPQTLKGAPELLMFDAVFVTCLRDLRSFRLAQATVASGLRGAGRVLAIVPDDERDRFERLPLRAAVVPESALDPRLSALPRSWFKQQLLKLCLHRVYMYYALA